MKRSSQFVKDALDGRKPPGPFSVLCTVPEAAALEESGFFHMDGGRPRIAFFPS